MSTAVVASRKGKERGGYDKMGVKLLSEELKYDPQCVLIPEKTVT